MKKTDIKNFIEELYLIIERRAKASSKKSYTKKILKKGPKTIAQKFGEESAELLIEYLSGSKKRTIEEASDVFYHLMVLLYSKKISLIEIKKELERRKKNVR